jgi:hypothetical protein
MLTLAKGRLLHFLRKGRGGRELIDQIPKGGLHWFTTRAENLNAYAVVGNLQTAYLHLLEILLDRGHCEMIPLELPRGQLVKTVCAHNGALLVICGGTVEVLEMATGRHLQSLALPRDVEHLRGRLMTRDWGRSFLALSFDGTAARLESALGTSGERCPNLLTMFERQGIDGPLGVTERGDLYRTATGDLRKVDHGLIGPIVVNAISADGRRVVLGMQRPAPSATPKRVVVDVDTLAVRTTLGDPRQLAEPELHQGPPPTLRNRFFEIFVSRAGELILRSRREHLAIVYSPSGDQICFTLRSDSAASGPLRRSFEPVEGFDRGYELHTACFQDGSRAVLDARGLLHLASSDKSVPEVTLVLHDAELSGWCSDGRMWGREYFIGDVRGANKHDVFQSAIKRFVERLT